MQNAQPKEDQFPSQFITAPRGFDLPSPWSADRKMVDNIGKAVKWPGLSFLRMP
jgi:hypothetical protein